MFLVPCLLLRIKNTVFNHHDSLLKETLKILNLFFEEMDLEEIETLPGEILSDEDLPETLPTKAIRILEITGTMHSWTYFTVM